MEFRRSRGVGDDAAAQIQLCINNEKRNARRDSTELGALPNSLGVYKEEGSPHMRLTGQEHLTNEEAYDYAHAATGAPFKAWQQECAVRTDGRARRIMFSAFAAGVGVDQVKVVEEEKDVLLGVINELRSRL